MLGAASSGQSDCATRASLARRIREGLETMEILPLIPFCQVRGAPGTVSLPYLRGWEWPLPSPQPGPVEVPCLGAWLKKCRAMVSTVFSWKLDTGGTPISPN